MKINFLIVFVLIFVGACAAQPKNVQECSLPSIMVGGECCLDKNNNSLCDDIEASPLTGHVVATMEENSKQKEQQAIVHIALDKLKTGINETFYPLGSYNFSFVERKNITGVEATFDVWGADPFRFSILKFKKQYNFLNTEKNFSDFVTKRYNLEVRNTNTVGQEYIDARKYDDERWERAKFDYNHDLEKLNLNGNAFYYEVHETYWDIDNLLEDLSVDFKISLWCTPELIVEIYSSESFAVPYFQGSEVSTNKERLQEAIAKEKADMVIVAGRILTLCQTGNTNPVDWKSNEIIFKGKGGFYPMQIKIKAGDKVIIHNRNDQYSGAGFTFIREKPSRKVFSTKGIDLGDSAEVIIDEPGEYTVFSPEHAGRGKIVAE